MIWTRLSGGGWFKGIKKSTLMIEGYSEWIKREYTVTRTLFDDEGKGENGNCKNSPNSQLQSIIVDSVLKKPSSRSVAAAAARRQKNAIHAKLNETTANTSADGEASPSQLLQSLQTITTSLNLHDSSPLSTTTTTTIIPSSPSTSSLPTSRYPEPYHIHVFSSRHNTHLTLTKPNRDALISVSTGNIGFKKGNRGSFDAAYRLTAWVMEQIDTRSLLNQIKSVEIIFRGYGRGREAFTKALLGQEGRFLRQRVTRISDATRLKFGGTRSRKPRRL